MVRLAPLALLLISSLVVAQPSASWQQEVAYEMDVRLATTTHRLSGHQRLVYTNHSPDTLRQVYYHLYFNAFNPASEMARAARRIPDPDSRIAPRIFNLEPDEIGWLKVQRLTQDGAAVASRVTDTILEVDLATPLLPGTSTIFEMTFEGQVPVQIRRSGRDNREGVDYTMTQWYPKIAAYDARGWHAEPYIGREFYAPFGTFDVQITLPADYVVGATGILQNPEAVGHGYDQAPDIGLTSTGPAQPDSLRWHFRAENVHDFAWTADPDYRHAQFLIGGVEGRDEPIALHLLFLPDVAELWQPVPEWTAALLHFYSAEYGAYPYPQFTVAQGGDGGMEYPMLTAITGRRTPTSLFGVVAHELAHMWFYGEIGTDEVAFPWMDEGLTQFAEAEATAQLLSEGTTEADHSSALRDIVHLQQLGLYEPPHTSANDFKTNRAYNTASYDAGRALADLLGYVMGNAARDSLLRAYVARYQFKQPTPDDVRVLAEEISGLRLGWLFGPFLDEGARYDYAVAALNVDSTAAAVQSTITLRRNAPGVLPVAVHLRYADGSEARVIVPVAEAGGHGALPKGWTAAAPWSASTPTYTLSVDGPYSVQTVALDPEGRMLDFDITNNVLRHSEPGTH